MSSVKQLRPPYQKGQIVRDDSYREHVARQYCECCGAGRCVAAHMGHSSIAMKDDDYFIAALCERCHRQFDTAKEGKEKWWVRNVERPRRQSMYFEWLQQREKS